MGICPIIHCLLLIMQELCDKAGAFLDTKSQIIEVAVQDLISLLLEPETEIPAELVEEEQGDEADVSIVDRPGTAKIKRKVDLSAQMQAEAHELFHYFKQRTLEAVLNCVRGNMELLRRKITSSSQHYTDPLHEVKGKPPIFQASIILALPTIVMRPSVEDVQQAVVNAAQMMVGVSKHVFEWGQTRPSETKESVASMGGSSQVTQSGVASRSRRSMPKLQKTTTLRTYFRQVSEHKEILKLLSAFSTAISSQKKRIMDSFQAFAKYEPLWSLDREKRMKEMEEEKAGVSEFHSEMKHYRQLEEKIGEEDDVIVMCPMQLSTEEIKLALVTEAKAWVVSYGRTMDTK